MRWMKILAGEGDIYASEMLYFQGNCNWRHVVIGEGERRKFYHVIFFKNIDNDSDVFQNV